MAACLISVVETIFALPNAVVIELDENLFNVAFIPPEIQGHLSDVDLKHHTKKLSSNLVSSLATTPHECAVEVKVCKGGLSCKLKGCYVPSLCNAAINPSKIPCLMERPYLQIRVIKKTYPSELASLTSREKEILNILLQGHPQKKISQLAGISAFTVNDHLKSIYKKIGVNSRGEALFKAGKWFID